MNCFHRWRGGRGGGRENCQGREEAQDRSLLMEATHTDHRPHIKVGKDAEEEKVSHKKIM